LLGITTVVFGVGFAEKTASTFSITLAVVSATAIGVTAAVLKPRERWVAGLVAVLGGATSLFAVSTRAFSDSRSAAVLGENANGIGFVAALGLVAGLTLIRRPHVMTSFLGGVAVVMCSVALFVSGSRSALVAAISGAVALTCHRLFRTHQSGARSLALLGVLALVVILVAGPLTRGFLRAVGRDEVLAQVNLADRGAALDYAVRAGLASPITGVGLGRLAEESGQDPVSGPGLSAHNVFAGLFAEAGVAPFVALVGLSLVALLRACRYSPRTLLPLVVSTLSGGIAFGWWGASRLGPLALLILGAVAARSSTERGCQSGALAAEKAVSGRNGAWTVTKQIPDPQRVALGRWRTSQL
jgi:O-antigen ligase